MNKRALLTDSSGEVRQLTPDDAARFKPAGEVLPDALREVLGVRRRGPQKTPTKVPTTIRFDVDLLEALKSSGEGWQTRVNQMLRREVLGDT